AEAGGRTPDAAAPPDLSWHEAVALLHEELDRLPEKYRRPLLLCHLEGKARDEAARELGWSLGCVKGRLERGRQFLRARLARRGVALSAALLAAQGSGPATAAPPRPPAEATPRAPATGTSHAPRAALA